MAVHLHRGKEGEELAAKFLEAKGFVILERNFRHGRGEIDLIAQCGSLLVFVEVKRRRSSRYGYPEEAVHQAKRNRLRLAAEAYLLQKNWIGPIRFDVIALLDAEGLEHFEDVSWQE